MRLTAVEKEEQDQVKKLGGNYKQKTKITVPSDALIRRSIENMSSIGEDEQDTLKRLIEVSYYLAVNGCPYMDFHGLVELEKMHGLKFLQGKSSERLFQEDLENMKQANFISILSDEGTDAAIVEKECIYILFVDPDEFKPKLLFFTLKELKIQMDYMML